ncbi:MAG: hypothetical protein ACKO7R_16345, partial [Pseudanabaena sp.]
KTDFGVPIACGAANIKIGFTMRIANFLLQRCSLKHIYSSPKALVFFEVCGTHPEGVNFHKPFRIVKMQLYRTF